jgi:hypothetical protein
MVGTPVLGSSRNRALRAGFAAGAVEELVLFLDHDAGGRRADALAREAFAHLPRIEARYPSRPGDDWNDVLRASFRG